MSTNTTTFKVKAGIKKAKGLAPTASDLYGGDAMPSFGAGAQVLLTEPKIEIAPTMVDDESVNGTQFATGQDVAMLPVKVSASHEVRTIGSGQLLFHAFGYDSLQGPVASGTKHAHLLCIDPDGKDQTKYTAAEILQVPAITANDYKNRYFHVMRQEGMGNLIARNATIKEFSLACEQKSTLKMEFSGTAQDHVIDADFSQSAGLALPFTVGEAVRLKLSNLKVGGAWIGVWNADNSAITESRECMLNFSVSNSFGQAEGVATSCSGLYQAEPVADGFNELSVEFSRYKVDTYDWLERLTSGTKIAMKVLFTVGDYKLYLFMPMLSINNVSHELGDGGKITVTAKGLYIEKANDPFVADRTVGATEMVLPFDCNFYALVVNDDATNYMRLT